MRRLPPNTKSARAALTQTRLEIERVKLAMLRDKRHQQLREDARTDAKWREERDRELRYAAMRIAEKEKRLQAKKLLPSARAITRLEN